MFSNFASAISGNAPDKRSQDEGASLTSVLETPTLRVELALLVLLSIDGMRNDLTATFEPYNNPEPNPSATTQPPAPSTKTRAPDLISFDEPRHTAARPSPSRERSNEYESTQTQALRRSALTFFDKWRASVMHRICDVISVRGETVRQAKVKRKQALEQNERQKQGISSLIDFDDVDPFANTTPGQSGKTKHEHYEVIESRLLTLDEEKRVLILHCLLLLLLSLEQYSAYSRVLLLRLASSLKLEADLLGNHEQSVAQGLLATAASQMDAEATAKNQASNNAASRRWKVGLATVGGAVLIGVTGGLAAPLLAAGLGTVMGGLGLGVVSTYLGALAGSSVLVGSLFGAYGAKMTGCVMDQYAREIQDFEFLPVQDPDRPVTQRELDWADELDARDPQKREKHRLRVFIGVSGWLNSPADVSKPWEVIDSGTTEPFALRFELDAMLRLGNSLNDVLFGYAFDGVTYAVVSRTLLGALYAGLWPLGLVKAASVLDNPFSVALARADKAGKVLAHALIDGVQGKRPVTLTGYSVGARVVYACLIELAEQHAFGLVESAVLMGAPAPANPKRWRQIRSVVAGRVVNVYSKEDYVLGFLYRSAKLQVGVAGLREVEDVHDVENVDVSKLISGHDRYRYLAGTILVKLGFDDVDFNKVAEQERALEEAEKRKTKAQKEAKRMAANKQTQKPVPEPRHRPVPTTQGSSNSLIDVSELVPTATPARNLELSGLSLTSAGGQEYPSRNVDASGSGLPKKPLMDRPKSIPTTTALVPDSHDHPNTENSALRLQKTGTGVAVTEVLVLEGSDGDNIGNEHQDNFDDYDCDAEEVSSEFGELSMVEPLPMDDNDYGLM
ncbi:hypothetical protein G6011_03391 [Alternaria panax]|uniref:DUF726-domain-containing protein n=1 Tax=Alternaria panax TaxID=48097 RepID=A0AAD4NR01_9PLEO|nr:hypothetical protein G6011_03391 [Alternaria panax]